MCLIFCQKKVLLLAYDFCMFKLKTTVFNLKIHPSKVLFTHCYNDKTFVCDFMIVASSE